MSRTDRELLEDWNRYLPNETHDEYNTRHSDPPEDISAANFREVLRTQTKCAAGDACKAHSEADLAASFHHCVGCCLKVHSAVLCGETLAEVVVNYPHLVGSRLSPFRVIVKGADDNEEHCLCFSCIANMNAETEPVGISTSAADKENVIANPNSSNNLIEKCSWDDIVVTTTHTNAVSRMKKGEPLKSSNSTRLMGFRVDSVLIPTEKIVKDHLQRWAIRHNKRRARQMSKHTLCESIVAWKGEHDESVANGTAELINPSTNMPLRFNMKRFINVIFGTVMLPQLAERGRVLTAGDLEDGKKTDQDLFTHFLVQYNDADNLSYASHAFEQVDDFVNAANFFPFPTTEWENAKRRFAELMSEYEKLRNRRSGFHNDFAERMAEEMKTSTTHTYPLMLYLHRFLERNESILDTCLSYLPCDVFSESTSGAPRPPAPKKGGGRYQRPGGKGGSQTSVEAGMQSRVLASVSAKNAVQAHATAAQLVAATMNNKQSQRDRKRMLMKEFSDDLGGGSDGRSMARERIERYKKRMAKEVAADDLDDDDGSMGPDSQETLIESILECDDNICNLDSIHVQQKELLGSTLLDASCIGKR